MKNAFVIGSILIMGLGGLWLFSLDQESASKVDTAIRQSNSSKFVDAQKQVDGGAQLIDVRTSAEFNDGHFAQATNLSLQDIQTNKLPAVAKDAKIYLYCQSGNRAGQALALLKSAGYTNVESLGGLSDVTALGGTLQR